MFEQLKRIGVGLAFITTVVLAAAGVGLAVYFAGLPAVVVLILGFAWVLGLIWRMV